MTAETDALAEVLTGHEMVVTYEGRLAGCVTCRACRVMGEWTGVDTLSAVRKHDAHVLLASDWLAQRDRRVAAEALREAADLGPINFAMTHEEPKWRGYNHLVTTRWLRQRADRIERGE